MSFDIRIFCDKNVGEDTDKIINDEKLIIFFCYHEALEWRFVSKILSMKQELQ